MQIGDLHVYFPGDPGFPGPGGSGWDVPDVRTGQGATYVYHAPSDDHAQALVSVRFHYATIRRASTSRQMTMFNASESYGLRSGEATFIVDNGLGALV